MSGTSDEFERSLDAITRDMAAGRSAAALQAAKVLVDAHPGAARAHNVQGILRAGAGDGDGAVASFNAAIACEPGFGEASYNLALVLCQQQRFDAAIEPLKHAIGLNHNIAPYHLVLGNALRQIGKGQEAIAAYGKALAIGGIPEALIQNNLGGAHLELGEIDPAIDAFSRAVALDPRSGEYHENLGNALRRAGRLREALEVLESAVRLDAKSARAAALLANTLRDLGRHDEAIPAYRKALQLRPDDKQSAYHLGLTLLDMGQTGEGLRVIEAGPGVARISAGTTADERPTPIPIALTGQTPTFIGAWQMTRPDLCHDLISLFEKNHQYRGPGRTGSGVDEAAKRSIDLTLLPSELNKPGHEVLGEYLRHLEQCYRAYAAEWPFLGGILPRGEIMPFTIQRYGVGGHFQRVHSERDSMSFAHRVLAWMSYLNDVEEGGETSFPHFGLAIKPERGKTLIWPAEWTHAHAGGIVTKGEKYIITGWIHFPRHPG